MDQKQQQPQNPATPDPKRYVPLDPPAILTAADVTFWNEIHADSEANARTLEVALCHHSNFHGEILKRKDKWWNAWFAARGIARDVGSPQRTFTMVIESGVMQVMEDTNVRRSLRERLDEMKRLAKEGEA